MSPWDCSWKKILSFVIKILTTQSWIYFIETLCNQNTKYPSQLPVTEHVRTLIESYLSLLILRWQLWSQLWSFDHWLEGRKLGKENACWHGGRHVWHWADISCDIWSHIAHAALTTDNDNNIIPESYSKAQMIWHSNEMR